MLPVSLELQSWLTSTKTLLNLNGPDQNPMVVHQLPVTLLKRKINILPIGKNVLRFDLKKIINCNIMFSHNL